MAKKSWPLKSKAGLPKGTPDIKPSNKTNYQARTATRKRTIHTKGKVMEIFKENG